MACFTVPVTEAIITNIVTKVVKNKEKETNSEKESFDTVKKIPFSRKLKWLSNLLWGGSALLAFEHVWHGEVVPYFPFLTAASNPKDAAVMLHEIATVGVSMSLLITAVWGVMVAVSSVVEKRALNESSTVKGGAR